MRYVLDASVAVAAARPNEPLHVAARARLRPIFRGVDAIVVPALFQVEVSSALARAGVAMDAVLKYVDRLVARATVITLGPRGARRAARVAISTRLRAADAIYVWLAARDGIPLVTADTEIHRRASAVCQVEAP